MKNENNIKKVEESSLTKVVKKYYLILFILVGLFIIEFITLGVIYLNNKSDGVRIALFSVSLSLLIVIVLYVVYVIFRYTSLFYGGLFENTLENYKRIVAQDRTLNKYKNKQGFIEFKELNNTIDEIGRIYEIINLANGKLNYKKYGLTYIEGFSEVVTYDSFERKYKEILDASGNFRHALISFRYPRNQKCLTKEEMSLFTMMSRNTFNYENLLFIDNSKNNTYYLYIPRFDSLSFLKETIEKAVASYCVNRNTPNGYEMINCKIAAVIYPYSHYDDFLSDIRYAERQNKLVNIYIPNKPDIGEQLIKSDNRNSTIVSSSLEKLTSFDDNGNISFDQLNNKVKELFENICKYFNFELAGVISYNPISDKYENIYAFGQNNVVNTEIEKSFISALKEHCDKDGSLYFSKRNNVDKSIGRFLDRFGIESGFYYVAKNNNKVSDVVYFSKKTTTLFDSYIRDSLLVFSFYIANYLFLIRILRSESKKTDQLNDILKITGCALYSINNADYSILSFSPGLKQLIPGLKIGDICYEAIAGKNKRCDKCPLRNGKKVITKIKNYKYESSLALTNIGGAETHILLSPIKSNDYAIRERFDHDLLINSYYSFFEAVKDAFMIRERGYLLSINIDNIDYIVSALPSERLNSYLRSFFTDIKKIVGELDEIYLLSNYSFGVIIPNGNINDVIELAEKIYNLSKHNYLNNNDIKLNLSYFVLPYPFGYQNPDDYSKFVKSNSISKKDLVNKDFIYVNETKYARSASHQKYLIDVLNTSINSNNFKVKLQPVVNKDNKRIISSELLFRIADSNRGGELNTLEVINAATSENKIHIITNLLVNYINKLYTTYEKTLFKKYNLNHLSMNVDYSFFKDENFINNYKSLKEGHKLADDFLYFEIAEKELSEHILEIGDVISNIKSLGSPLICDNFTGEFVSLNKIKELGFSGIKINYRITSQIDKENGTYDALVNIIDTCKNLNLSVTVVGVETSRQYALLNQIKTPFTIQGYYFYRPLDEQELANALFKNNG